MIPSGHEKGLPWWLKPHNISLWAVLLSFLAWLIPMETLPHGFDVRERLTLQAAAVLCSWYALIYFCAKLGYTLGLSTKRVSILTGGNVERAYRLLSYLAWVAVFIVYTFGIGWQNAMDFITEQNANRLKYTLEQNYLMGIYSLRWLTIPAGGIALYRIFFLQERGVTNVCNVVALVLNGLICSRLSLMCAILVCVCLAVSERRLRLRFIVTVAVISFLLLTFLTFSRNAPYYRQRFGIESPYLMNACEMVTYLAAPFQGAIGVANHLWLSGDPDAELFVSTFVIPTFLVNGERLLALEQRWKSPRFDYRTLSTIWPNLTTNSAFANMYVAGGYWAFIWMAVSAFIAAFLAGHFCTYSNLVRVACFILLYVFAEIWRVYIFNSGLVYLSIGGLLFCTAVSKFRLKLDHQHNKLRMKRYQESLDG